MNSMLRVPVLLPVIALAVASATAWTMQTGSRLMMDGAVVSTGVQIVQGRPYVLLSDVAKVLDRTLVKKGATYTLTRLGDAHQMRSLTGKSLTGKLAENIRSGPWQFQVASVQQVSGYSPQYGSEKEQLTPKEANDILVVLKCRLKNTTNVMREVSFDENAAGNTALTDDHEHGYVPLAYDSRNSGYTSDKMPAGSAHDFVVIFSIPKGVNLKDLTYTVGDTGADKSTDFRVALKP
jgi:hypothetical protein